MFLRPYDDNVADRRTRWDGSQMKTCRTFNGKILKGVNCNIDASLKQGFFNFFCEESLALDFVEGEVLDPVTGRFDNLNTWWLLDEIRYVVGLPQGEVTPSGPNNQFRFTHIGRLSLL